jgi:hypothetical protein
LGIGLGLLGVDHSIEELSSTLWSFIAFEMLEGGIITKQVASGELVRFSPSIYPYLVSL